MTEKMKRSALLWLTSFTSSLAFGRPIPSATERAIEREALQRRIRQGPMRIDDVKRLNALDDLDGPWGCKPLRVLLYKLRRDDD